jgi:hypothetical protein
VSIGSWAILYPSRNLIWEKKRRLDDLKTHWICVVRAFTRRQPGENVENVLIAHVYEHRDILKEFVSSQDFFPQIGLNYKGSSFYKN